MKSCIVGTTFSKTTSDHRFDLNQETVRVAIDLGYPVFIVDGSPIPEIGETLAQLGATVVPQTELGMGPSRSQCIGLGINRGYDIITWMELEKTDMPNHLHRCTEPIADGTFDIVCPRREDLDGYPDYQHWSELRTNWAINRYLGRFDLDLMVGVRCMNRRAAQRMAAYKGEDGKYGNKWQILFHPVVDMVADPTFKVGSVSVPFTYPAIQARIERGGDWDEKRDEQRVVIAQEIKMRAQERGIVQATMWP